MTMPSNKSLDDLAPVAFSDQSTAAIRTGTWKYVEPAYLDKLPPCSHLCPAGNDISKFLYLMAKGETDAAARLVRAGNPLPATLGRVCPHPCESQCNRAAMGGAIAIHMMERHLGDHAADKLLPNRRPATGRRVAVIGAGPAGIAAAYNLALAGHQVEVLDEKGEAGGYLRTGIPAYRLPREVLDREIALVREAGVVFRAGFRAGRDAGFVELRKQFDAIVVAIGFHKNRALDIPGEDSQGVYNGVSLLERILMGERPNVPASPVVVGGGNTAMDVARSLLRLGSRPTIVYRRTRAEMPAIAAEVAEAEAEGIPFHYLTAPVKVITEGGRVSAIECLRMRLGEPDASGRRRPVPIDGSNFAISCDGIVTAIGETADMEFLPAELRDDWRIKADTTLATPTSGVFAAGDAMDGAGTVTAAVGSGRRAAAMADAFLHGGALPDSAPRVVELWDRALDRDQISYIESLNTAYLSTAPRPDIQELPAASRTRSFVEVVQAFSAEQAILEARRCFVCGTCNECSNCLYFCPDFAIHKRADTFGFDIDAGHCKGCGICVEECPRDAMVLREVVR